MTTNYARHFSPLKTSQDQPIPGREKDMVANRAGGFGFTLAPWKQAERFLILGTEGGTYYASEREMTVENASIIKRLAEDEKSGLDLIDLIVQMRKENRAPKVDPLLFALAVCSAFGAKQVRIAVGKALLEVAWTGTQLFQFVHYLRGLRGLGVTASKAIAGWYSKDLGDLGLQVAKYRSRFGYTHRDLIRLVHPKPTSAAHADLFGRIARDDYRGPHDGPGMKYLNCLEALQEADTAAKVLHAINTYRPPWELVPTEWLKDARVAKALLQIMPVGATIRQLGRYSALGFIGPLSDTEELIINRLQEHAILSAKIHPLQILTALKTYEQGKGDRGSLTWKPNERIVSHLDRAFGLAFKNVQPTEKYIYLGIDVSGSMTVGSVCGVRSLTPRVGAAAMALVTARTEPNCHVAAFAGEMVPVRIHSRSSIDSVIRETDRLPFGSTDCSLPMRDAIENRMFVEVFVIYTDNETWYGQIHPVQALREYRRKCNGNARLVVVGMTSTGYTIADPNDPNMLDVVGFDTSTPNVISAFAKT